MSTLRFSKSDIYKEECAVLLLDTDFPEHTKSPDERQKPAKGKHKRKAGSRLRYDEVNGYTVAYEMVIVVGDFICTCTKSFDLRLIHLLHVSV